MKANVGDFSGGPTASWYLENDPGCSRPGRRCSVGTVPIPAAPTLGPSCMSRSSCLSYGPIPAILEVGLRWHPRNLKRRSLPLLSAAGLRPIPLLRLRRSRGLARGDALGQFPAGAAPGRWRRRVQGAGAAGGGTAAGERRGRSKRRGRAGRGQRRGRGERVPERGERRRGRAPARASAALRREAGRGAPQAVPGARGTAGESVRKGSQVASGVAGGAERHEATDGERGRGRIRRARGGTLRT